MVELGQQVLLVGYTVVDVVALVFGLDLGYYIADLAGFLMQEVATLLRARHVAR